MIHDEEKQEILSNFEGTETSFAIDATSSHIFDILRDKQYSNGKESLVREIIANAKDSHAEAGKSDVPIRIWLNQNYLTIQDFGVGISPERMENTYRHFGRSTKRGSNEQQGFYGIGAKSFFAYASSASITSIYNGIKYEYIAYINETNVGGIRLVSEESTDEGNGVSIKVPIQPQHFSEFRGYVKKYAQFMDPVPEILGDNIYGPTEPPKVSLEGTNWKIFSDPNLSCFNVLLDGIPYRYSVPGNVSGITFIFNTGELIPSATREGLSVCEKNTRALDEAINVFKKEIVETVDDTLKNIDDFTEVIKTIHSSRKFFSLYAREWKFKGGTLEYPFDNLGSSMMKCSYTYGALRKSRANQFEPADPKPNSIILVDDDFDFYGIKGYISRKINYHRSRHGLNTVYLVKACHNVPDSAVTKFEDIKISNPSAARAPRVKNAQKTNIYVKLRGKTTRSLIQIDRKNLGDVIYTRQDISTFYGQYKGLGYIPVTCVEVQEKDVKLIKAKPGWYTIQEYIEEKLTKSLTKEKIELEYKRAEAAAAYYSYSYLKDYLHEDFKVGFEPTTLTHEQLNLVKFIQTNGELEKPEVPDLYERYPLLKVIDKSEVGKIPDASDYYYNIKIELKDVVQYINLINQQTESKNV